MPSMTYTPQSQVSNDKSSLTIGRHPAFLIEIGDEETPPTWKMYEKSPRLWRWHFVVWPTAADVGRTLPEYQTAITSQKFSPEIKARNGNVLQASKAYEWTSQLLGYKPAPGEPVDLEPTFPLACYVKIDRKDDYANIKDVERWPEGDAIRTQGFLDELKAFLADRANGTLPVQQAAAPVPAPQPQATGPAPGMQSWNNPLRPAASGATPRF